MAELLVSRGCPIDAEALGLSRESRKRSKVVQLSRSRGFRVQFLIEQSPDVLLLPSTLLAWAIENDAKAVKGVLLPLVGSSLSWWGTTTESAFLRDKYGSYDFTSLLGRV